MVRRAWYQHAIAVLISIGGVYMATLIQWPALLRTTPHDGNSSNGTHTWRPTVLLISLDGLKPQYVEGGNMPTLNDLVTGKDPLGASMLRRILTARSMIPVSPSLTFPNHWTLQTGLLPSSHGIIANDFHIQSSSNDIDQSFYYTDPSRSWNASWWHGTPIWGRLETLDIKTANLMWPGPPVTSNDIRSTYFQKYEKAWSLDNRVDKIMSWLDKEDSDRPQFICAYAPDVDSITHSLGPNESITEVAKTLQKIDSLLLDVLHGIETRNASSLIDVIIVSDHGMTSTSNNRLVYLEELLGERLYSRMKYWDGWPNVGLRFDDITDVQQATMRLREVAKSNEGKFEVATRHELTVRWGWDDTKLVEERMADLWILPEMGWSITTKEEMASFDQDYRPKGNHGYHASNDDMHAFFMALGPSFRDTDERIESFVNLEIHNLVMDLLKVPEMDRASNNGTHGFWHPYLQKR